MTTALNAADRRTLLDVARQSIGFGLLHGRPLAVRAADYSPALQPQRATFVTLQRQGHLRGCIGMLEAIRPLVEDVAENAYAAAFHDPRFSPLRPAEMDGLDIHISILSPPAPLEFTSQEELLQKIRSGVDGLIMEETVRGNRCRGTFLPAVWEDLPDPRQFLEHLKLKAGLPAGYWSNTLRIWRYTAEGVGKE